MSEVWLVRHGQAQTGASDEASYDRLSDLGHQQAAWLGEHLRATTQVDLLIAGGMRRQQETAHGLGLTGVPVEVDPRLNELDYFGMAADLVARHGIDAPTDSVTFAQFVPTMIEVWRNDALDTRLESYRAFCDRITGAVRDAAAREGRVVLLTSTGVISTLTALALELDARRKTKVFLSVAHTSVHKFEVRGDELFVTQFGATPHLDRTDRDGLRTFV